MPTTRVLSIPLPGWEGPPPPRPGSGHHVGYFENEYGEQLVYVHERGQPEGTLYHSDYGWQPVRVTDGLTHSLLLNQEEQLWLTANWAALLACNYPGWSPEQIAASRRRMVGPSRIQAHTARVFASPLPAKSRRGSSDETAAGAPADASAAGDRDLFPALEYRPLPALSPVDGTVCKRRVGVYLRGQEVAVIEERRHYLASDTGDMSEWHVSVYGRRPRRYGQYLWQGAIHSCILPAVEQKTGAVVDANAGGFADAFDRPPIE